MNKIHAILVAIALFSLAGCSSSIKGTLTGFDKDPVPGVLVRLIVIDDEGNELEEVGFAVTDEGGHFDVGYRDSVGSSFVVEAVLPEGRLRGFACGDGSNVDLNPVTDAILQSIIYVTQGDGERSLADFSVSELRNIIKEVGEDEEVWALDFTDSEALTREIIDKAGMLIPEAAGGELTAVPLASVEHINVTTDPDPSFVYESTRPCSRDNYWIESGFFGFDILQDGALCKSGSVTLGLFSAYNIAYQLQIENDTFVDTGDGSFPGNGGIDVPDIKIEDDRKVCFGPVLTTNGLSVTRKVYVPELGDYARYLEIFSNPTGSDITINIKIGGSLSLGEFVIYGTGIQTLTEESGDSIINLGDNWAASIAATYDHVHPTVGYVWDGLSGDDTIDSLSFPPSNSSSSFDYSWNEVTIPAGGTKTFMYYGYLSGTQNKEDVESLLKSAYYNADESLMSTEELNALQNFPVTRGNITGGSGSVPSFSDLTVTNETHPSSMTMKARRDGGFSANLDAQAGDAIKVQVKIGGSILAEMPLIIPNP